MSWYSLARFVLLACLVEVAREEPLQLLLGFLPAGFLLSHGTCKPRLVLKVLALDQLSVLLLAEFIQDGTDEAPCVVGIGLHVSHNHLNVDVLALNTPPAVVVGRHADHLVSNLSLSRQLGLRQSRHVDDGTTPATVHVGLCAGAELRALHADDGALVVQRDALTLQAVAARAHNLSQLDIEGVAEADVTDHALLKVCERTNALGAVDDLVRDYEVARADLLLQRADSGESDDSAHTEVTQSGHVGLVLDLMRREFMGEAVTREEGDGDIVAGRRRGVVQDADGRRGLAPRRVDIERRGESEARQRLNASAADYGDMNRRWGRGQLC